MTACASPTGALALLAQYNVAARTYTPNSRDNAQHARGLIYVALRDIPGKATFDALVEFAHLAPTEEARAWRMQQAIFRADPYSESQVYSNRHVVDLTS
ncbi:hypothetical protein [Roseobacter litoralis]|uniref:hypothetical protein n=1 Tax=Roseobacter litoralis TaxID=42443 RepID=UPI0024940352|nr:hypothetical protein [Roseobacter litoralis]